MRKVIYSMLVSLDGFIETSNGDLSWSFPDEELHKHFNEQEAKVDVHFYGRGLYENMSSFWPTADQDPNAPAHEVEYARIWKRMPKIVVSNTLSEVKWNSKLLRGNIAQEVAALKAQPGQDMSVGGAGLATSFMKLDLIDEYWLYVHPVILGGGKPMFGSLEKRVNLRFIETRTFGSGVTLLRYGRQ